MGKFWHKVTPKAKILSWLKAANEKVLAAIYIEEGLGSHYCVHIRCNMDTGEQRILFRTTKQIFSWVTVEPLQSQFINTRYWRIVSLEKPATPMKIETAVTLMDKL